MASSMFVNARSITVRSIGAFGLSHTTYISKPPSAIFAITGFRVGPMLANMNGSQLSSPSVPMVSGTFTFFILGLLTPE